MTTVVSAPAPPSSWGLKLARSTFWVSAASSIVAVIGFFREIATARTFGAGYQMDAFLVVFTVMTFFPNLVSQTLLGVFVPIFTRIRAAQGRRAAWVLTSSALNYVVLLFVLITTILFVFRRPLLAWAAPGFGARDFSAALPLFAIFVPVAVLWVANEYLKAVLNCMSAFFWPSFSQVWPGIGAIIGIVFWGSKLNVQALAWGWLAGSVAQTMVLTVQLLRSDFDYCPAWRPSQSGITELVAKSAPYLWVHFAITSLYFIDRHFASELAPGAIAQLYFADRLLRLPIVLFTIPLFTAFHPHVSERLVENGVAAVRVSLSAAIRTAAAITLPVSVIVAVLSRPIIALIYQGGSFGPSDVATTAVVLQYLMPLIFLTTAFYILDRIYNAFGDSKTLMWTAFAMIATKWVASALLVRIMGLTGLPAATILMHLTGVVVLGVLLRHKLGRTPAGDVWPSLTRVGAASLFAGGAVFGAHYLLMPANMHTSKTALMAGLAALFFVGTCVYMAALHVCGGQEARLVLKILKLSNTTA